MLRKHCISASCSRFHSSLESIQQTVNATDEFLSLAGQILLALDVRLLLDLARHKPLCLLARAVHHLLHLAVQFLDLANLRAQVMV